MNTSLSHFLRLAIEPNTSVRDPELREYSRMSVSLSLLSPIVFALMAAIASLVFSGTLANAVPFIITIPLFLIPYRLAKVGRVEASITANIAASVANLFLTSYIMPEPHRLFVLAYLSPIGLYGVTFLGIKRAIVVVVGYLTALVIIMPLALQIPIYAILREPFLFNALAAWCSIIIVRYWRQREAAQRQEVARSEGRYRVISEMTSDYMFFVRYDEHGQRHLEWVTESVERFSGYSIEEVFKQTDANIHPDDIERALAARQHVLQGNNMEADYRFFRKDGEMRWVRVHSRPVWDAAHKKVTGYYGAVRDITDHKNAQAHEIELKIRSEQFTLVEHFITAMSHDFRNRLATIESSRHLLQRMVEVAADDRLIPQMAPRMQTIQDSIRQMIDQLDNISMVTRLSHVQLTQVDLKSTFEALRARCEPIALAAGVKLRFEQDEGLSFLCVDPVQFAGALHHLVANAIAHSDADDIVTIRARIDGEYAIFEVSDEGSGIPAEDLDYIFEPFYKVGAARTVTRSGVGLGLTIVKLIVDAHGGRIEVESTLDKGSLFRLLFPIKAAGA